MNCWIGLCNIETKEGKIQRFNSCSFVTFCMDQFCGIMGSTEQTDLGEVHSVDVKKVTHVVRWLKVNCKHPQKDLIINHICACADAVVKVLLPNELKAEIERRFSFYGDKTHG